MAQAAPAHSGADHITPEQINARLLEDLWQPIPYAPLHLPAEIQGIEAVTARFPHLPQAAHLSAERARL